MHVRVHSNKGLVPLLFTSPLPVVGPKLGALIPVGMIVDLEETFDRADDMLPLLERADIPRESVAWIYEEEGRFPRYCFMRGETLRKGQHVIAVRPNSTSWTPINGDATVWTHAQRDPFYIQVATVHGECFIAPHCPDGSPEDDGVRFTGMTNDAALFLTEKQAYNFAISHCIAKYGRVSICRNGKVERGIQATREEALWVISWSQQSSDLVLYRNEMWCQESMNPSNVMTFKTRRRAVTYRNTNRHLIQFGNVRKANANTHAAQAGATPNPRAYRRA